MSSYLIVEDNVDKFATIRNELIYLGISEKAIIHATSVNEATNLMKFNLYSLVILDLNLPMTRKGKPIEKGGITLLNKLKQNPSKYNLPRLIIGLTSYDYLKSSQVSEFESLCFSLYDYELNDWKSVLRNKISWDLSSSLSESRSPGENIILSVHGIRTLGKWQDKLEKSINSSEGDFKVINYKYNYFSAFQLLVPMLRKKVINKLSKELEYLSEQYPNAKFTIFSHSFGTYALVKSLERLPLSCEIKINKLFLISSVLKSNYDLNNIKKRFAISTIFNECGFNDNVLLLSHYLCIDMGMAGRSGIVGTSVINRFYDGGHDFFNRDDNFITEYWLPSVLTLEQKNHDERAFSSIRENYEIMMYTRYIPLLILLFIMFSLFLYFF
ncbi:hypothetical protein [Vibrio alfacsensis]|uniref:hypothetical protein n=1 Tax=Vibrio alfacsensis TaxID=1074311 RepID=UPI004068743B